MLSIFWWVMRWRECYSHIFSHFPSFASTRICLAEYPSWWKLSFLVWLKFFGDNHEFVQFPRSVLQVRSHSIVASRCQGLSDTWGGTVWGLTSMVLQMSLKMGSPRYQVVTFISSLSLFGTCKRCHAAWTYEVLILINMISDNLYILSGLTVCRLLALFKSHCKITVETE